MMCVGVGEKMAERTEPGVGIDDAVALRSFDPLPIGVEVQADKIEILFPPSEMLPATSCDRILCVTLRQVLALRCGAIGGTV